MIASVIDGLISLAIGVWMTLVGFGVISPSKDKKKGEEMRQKWGWFMKIGGLFVAAWGVYNIVRVL